MLEYTTTIVTAPEATTATAAQWEHCIGLIVQAHTEFTLRLPKSKAAALAVLARLVAAVEALPDDTHAGQGVLPTEPECDGLCVDSSDIGVPGYGIAYAHPGCPLHDTPGRKCECGTPDRCLSPTHDPAPVWRTLTFGDLRAKKAAAKKRASTGAAA